MKETGVGNGWLGAGPGVMEEGSMVPLINDWQQAGQAKKRSKDILFGGYIR